MKEEILTGTVIDEHVELSTHELCRVCGGSTEWVIELVEEGVLDVRGDDSGQWRFTGATLSRAIRARRLQRDLELNLPGVALVLDMMDELERLRQQLRQRESS